MQPKEQKRKKNEEILWEMWNTIKYTKLYLTGVPEGKELEEGEEKMSKETTAKNFSNLMRNINLKKLSYSIG